MFSNKHEIVRFRSYAFNVFAPQKWKKSAGRYLKFVQNSEDIKYLDKKTSS